MRSAASIKHEQVSLTFWGWCTLHKFFLPRTASTAIIGPYLLSKWVFAFKLFSLFLANVTFTFAICYRPSVCRLSSVCLSVICLSSVVCNIRAPYSDGLNFRQYFYGVMYIDHPMTSAENFTEMVPGEPLRRGS